MMNSYLIQGYVTEDGPITDAGAVANVPNRTTGGWLNAQPESMPAPAMPITPVPGRKQFMRGMVTVDHPIKQSPPYTGKFALPSPLTNAPLTYQSPLGLRQDWRRNELLIPDSRLV